MTSELNERRWAVMSERGREESGLSYEDASRLVARLRAERLGGLCVITDAAASHVPEAKKKAAANSPPPGDSKPARAAPKPRRAQKKAS